MADNVAFQTAALATPANGVRVAADEVTYSGDTAVVQLTREVAVAGNEGSRTVVERYASRSDTYTGAANGTTVDASTRPMRAFGMQVKGTGASATSWTVVLEGSLDGTNFTTLLTHTNTTQADGSVLWSSAAHTPCLYFRSRCTAVVLGGATNIVCTILGVP